MIYIIAALYVLGLYPVLQWGKLEMIVNPSSEYTSTAHYISTAIWPITIIICLILDLILIFKEN